MAAAVAPWAEMAPLDVDVVKLRADESGDAGGSGSVDTDDIGGCDAVRPTCGRAEESSDGGGGGSTADVDGSGGGGSVGRGGSSGCGCGAVELTSLETAAAVDASTQTASEDAVQSR